MSSDHDPNPGPAAPALTFAERLALERERRAEAQAAESAGEPAGSGSGATVLNLPLAADNEPNQRKNASTDPGPEPEISPPGPPMPEPAAAFKLDEATLLSDLRELSNSPGFGGNLNAQTHVTIQAIKYWDNLSSGAQSAIKQEIFSRIPRFDVPDPDVIIELMIGISRLDPGNVRVNIARSISAFGAAPPYIKDHDHELFSRTTGWVKKFMEYGKHNEVPYSFLFWAAISGIGAACRYKVWVDYGIQEIRMNQYILFSAQKSVGKSVAAVLMKDIIRLSNLRINPKIAAGQVDVPSHPGSIRVLPEDATKEGLIERLRWAETTIADRYGVQQTYGIDSTGWLFVDELSTMFGSQAHAVDTKLPFFTTIYNAKEYEKVTKTSGSPHLKNCALSMIAGCAPDWLRSSITQLAFGGGFMDRVRIVYRGDMHSPRTYSVPVAIDPLETFVLAEAMVKVMMIDEPYQMSATPEAFAWYDNWYINTKAKYLSEGRDKGLSMKRLALHTWKIAACLSISDSMMSDEQEINPYIQLSHMQLAAEILEYEERHFLELVKFMEEDESYTLQEKLMRCLLDAGGIMPRSDFHAKVRTFKGMNPMNRIGMKHIEDLLSLEFVALDKTKRVNEDGKTVPGPTYYHLTDRGLAHFERSDKKDLLGVTAIARSNLHTIRKQRKKEMQDALERADRARRAADAMKGVEIPDGPAPDRPAQGGARRKTRAEREAERAERARVAEVERALSPAVELDELPGAGGPDPRESPNKS